MKRTFYEVLQQIMKDFKVNQKDLADKIGVGQSTISRYLAGIQQPSYEVLQKLSVAFNLSGDEVLGLD